MFLIDATRSIGDTLVLGVQPYSGYVIIFDLVQELFKGKRVVVAQISRALLG